MVETFTDGEVPRRLTWKPKTGAVEQESFNAGWSAGVAWARARERQRLVGCQHTEPCRSEESCYLTVE